jgi:general secretion pathway protein K
MAGYRRRATAVAAMRNRQRGFALLIVLFTVGFLALLGTQIVASGRSDTQLADNLKQQAGLEAAAEGAIENVGFSMLAARDSQFQADGMVRETRVGATPVLVRVENESDRINLNTASGVLLRALIIDVGGAPGLAGQVAIAILDWRTSSAIPRPGGAKAPEYQAAGHAYGPPGMPFQSVGELADVLGMTPDLLVRLAPHLTVLTDGDPDLSTRDPVVARALTDAAGVADDSANGQQTADPLLRISVTAVGNGRSRYSLVAVVSADFQNAAPRLKILLRQRGSSMTGNGSVIAEINKISE